MSKELEIQRLISYITGNCSDEEKLNVRQWIDSSEENGLLYSEYKLIWDKSTFEKRSVIIDLDSSWNSFKEKTDFDSHEISNSPSIFRKVLINVGRVAAVIVFLFSIWLMFDKESQPESINYIAESAQIDEPFLLPDGTEIIFNNGSQIVYPEFFTEGIRKIDFRGEAFFNIAHDIDNPMVITTGDIRVKVLGTSFNLCNYDESNEIILYLETGKVLFYSVDPANDELLEQVVLLPGERGVYNKITGSITKGRFDGANHMAWKSGILNFVNAPLSDVINALEHTYKLDVNSSIDLNEYRLTARFENETPESIFQSLQIIYGIKYTIKGSEVTLN